MPVFISWSTNKWWSRARQGVLAGLCAAQLVAVAAVCAQGLAEPGRPARAVQAERFVRRRGGLIAGQRVAGGVARGLPAETNSGSAATAQWQPAGPAVVSTSSYGLVAGRVSALALDPSDATGNRLYVGTTGGGVWVTQNAAASSGGSVVFTALTDTTGALGGVRSGSISIGAVTVQPGGTGVILAGTGDPNDALDSYYGAGVLRSTDNGTTWTLLQTTADQLYSFVGEGFAGFAWSTTTPSVVVAAVSQAYEGTLVGATASGVSYQGLYYSSDSGATWQLATITDGSGQGVQGPAMSFAQPDGNAATAVAWNPVRHLFVAAVRYHGYYQSADGVTWTRLSQQPGTGLTAALCPNNKGATGSTACPIFRGALAVNPQTGDTFAWTVDGNNQDQGIWQDQCAISGGSCGNALVAFQRQWDTAALTSNTAQGAATVANGDYNLTLAAVPAAPGAGADTVLFAGGNDLWKCSLAMGCAWRNTTNFASCRSAQVAGYQHAVEWNAANTDELFVGNDGGLWRSMDQIGQSGTVCAATDSDHFANLNGSLGSLAEVESLAAAEATPYTLAAGLGANGTAGVKSATAVSGPWPQVMTGEGGPVAITPLGGTWLVNAGAGVAIYACRQAGACTPADFGAAPAVSQSDAGNDGLTMSLPAAMAVDAADSARLLVGTCRVWRGVADSTGWTSANAVSPILDTGSSATSCRGNSTIGALAAQKLAGGGEIIYVGMHGVAVGGGLLPGHVLSATLDATGTVIKGWSDLTNHPVGNDGYRFNRYGWEISSITIDGHDATGQTVYVTLEGVPIAGAVAPTVYRSVDGGSSWNAVASNLPWSPANSAAVDPLDAATVYVATDAGVYSTRAIGGCAVDGAACWTAYGTGLPWSPVTQLLAAPATASAPVLTAGTYGRGVWRIPLWTAGETATTATLLPAALSFAGQALGSTSGAQRITLTNTGTAALVARTVTLTGDFSATDNCLNVAVPAGSSCTIDVKFTPAQTGTRTGQLSVGANLDSTTLTATLSGTGLAAGILTATPTTLDFGSVALNVTSASLPVTVQNTGGAVAAFTLAVTGPFAVVANGCGGQVAAGAACQITVAFTPVTAGAASGTLTLTSSAGVQSVGLSGQGANPAGDTLSASSLSFADTVAGQQSVAQSVTLSNGGDLTLTGIAIAASPGFTATNNCGTQLAGRSSCTISVMFAPSQAGGQTGTLTVSDALRTQTVALQGTGIAPPVMAVSPASLSFVATQVGQTSAAQTLTVTNAGGAAMASVGFQITGQSAAGFATGGSTCGATLDKGASCTVQVTFRPVLAGGNAATLTVQTGTLGVTSKEVALSGTGTAAAGLGVSPASLSFGAVALGQSSAAQTVTVSNTGTVAAASLTLVTSAQYTLTQNTCPATLAAGASCTTGVVFAPNVLGAASGALTASSTSYSAAAVVLTGTGASSTGLTIAPNPIAFGTVAVGKTSSMTTVTVTNTGAVGEVSNLRLAASSGFVVVNNTCGTTLATGGSCTAGVEFVPTAAGAKSGTLVVSASSGSVSIPLSGTGFDFAMNVTGASSQAVAAGATASYTLAVTPSAGQGASFSFACGTLPSYAGCVFSANPATVAAGGTGNVNLQITTVQTLSASNGAARAWPGELVWLCALLVAPLAWRKPRRVLLLALVGLSLAAVQSCGGAGGGISGGPTGKNYTTPAGSYSIVVTATASGASHSVTLGLTVQ